MHHFPPRRPAPGAIALALGAALLSASLAAHADKSVGANKTETLDEVFNKNCKPANECKDKVNVGSGGTLKIPKGKLLIGSVQLADDATLVLDGRLEGRVIGSGNRAVLKGSGTVAPKSPQTTQGDIPERQDAAVDFRNGTGGKVQGDSSTAKLKIRNVDRYALTITSGSVKWVDIQGKGWNSDGVELRSGSSLQSSSTSGDDNALKVIGTGNTIRDVTAKVIKNGVGLSFVNGNDHKDVVVDDVTFNLPNITRDNTPDYDNVVAGKVSGGRNNSVIGMNTPGGAAGRPGGSLTNISISNIKVNTNRPLFWLLNQKDGAKVSISGFKINDVTRNTLLSGAKSHAENNASEVKIDGTKLANGTGAASGAY